MRVIQNGLKSQQSNEGVLKFYLAMTSIMQDKNQDAVKELDSIKNREEVGLGAMLALVFVHKKFSSIDRDTINELDSRIKEIRKKADETVIMSSQGPNDFQKFSNFFPDCLGSLLRRLLLVRSQPSGQGQRIHRQRSQTERLVHGEPLCQGLDRSGLGAQESDDLLREVAQC